MKIFVGNLEWHSTEAEIKSLFSEYGPVDSVTLCFFEDGQWGSRRKSFCFVEMIEAENALRAIINLDGKEFKGRKLVVQKAKTREEYLREKSDELKE